MPRASILASLLLATLPLTGCPEPAEPTPPPAQPTAGSGKGPVAPHVALDPPPNPNPPLGVPETVEDDPAAVVGIEATSACPVCGKAVDITNPPASVDYGDTHYLLCSESCLTAFQRSPKDFLRTEPLEKR